MIAQGLTYQQISSQLCIGYGTVYRTLNIFKATGNITSNPRNDRHLHILDEHHEFFIIGLILEHPTTYLHEVCDIVYSATRIHVSVPSICRMLKNKKKIKRVAQQRSIILRANFIAHMFLYSRMMFVWVDESGSDHRSFLRQYGYAIKGENAIKHTFLSRGKRINVILAISASGVVAKYITEENIDTCNFYDFLHGDLLPNLQPFDGINMASMVIMDNLSTHHTIPITGLLKSVWNGAPILTTI